MSIADKLVIIAENMPIVFNEGQKDGFDKGMKDGEEIGYGRGYDDGFSKGFDDGFTSGEELGIEEGKQAQYDLFWDTFQANGTRTNYYLGFANWVGAKAIFKPKYDIKPVGSVAHMFNGFQTYISLPDVCEEQGIVMDFSKATNFSQFMYNSCAIYRMGVIDCSSAANLNNAFLMATSLKTIDKLIVHEGITSYLDCFGNAALLENITIEGTIAGNSFNVSYHKNLTRESLLGIPLMEEEVADLPSTNVVELNGNYYYGGIIPALKDYSGTSTTKSITLGATNLAKLSDAEKAIATQKGWTLV